MIISDLCDEYAVLVSQNKAPVYGYDNVNVPYGLVINDDGILVEVRLLGDFKQYLLEIFLVYKKHGILIMTKKGMMINRH